MHKASQPIGIFDSGIGGLTVANAISTALPNEQIIYFGDTEHMPYGDKSIQTLKHFSEKIADFLLEKNIKLLVIACNSASAAAYDFLKEKLQEKVHVIDVINPIVQAVTKHQEIQKIGIIGTRATIDSKVYEQKILAQKPAASLVSLATPLLAPMIEEGFFNNSISKTIIENYLRYPDFSDIDAIILACTHYPLIRADVDAFFNGKVSIIDSTRATTEAVQEYLSKEHLLSEKLHAANEFYVSELTASFEKTTQLFFQKAVNLQLADIWN